MVERAAANTKNKKQIFSFDGENEDNSWTGHANEKRDITGPYHVSFETAIKFHEQQLRISVDAMERAGEGPGAPNDRFLGNDLKWLVMHPGVL